MRYELVKCPICGSDNIVLIKEEIIEKDMICFYKCNSCDSKFDTKNKYFKNKKYEDNILDNGIEYKKFSGPDIFEMNKDKVVEIYVDHGDKITAGTGVILSDNLLITNAHVIYSSNEENVEYKAKFAKQKEEFDIELKYFNFKEDLVVFNIYKGEPVKLASKPVKIGEKCYTLGNAQGEGICMLDGIISDSKRIVKRKEYIMFTALVSHGNSGGPLFNESGELIGIVTMGEKESPSMNYAITLKRLNKFLRKR